jgi:hypothetical protein
MFGWTILFGLISLFTAIPTLLGAGSLELAMKTASLLFAFLFFVSVLFRLVRPEA